MLQTLVQTIKERKISDIISKYIPLQKAGTSYRALCPFHDERTPSFFVNDEKGIFKCFGCGKSGDAITFVQLYENVSFSEAVLRLAQLLGLPIEGLSKQQSAYLRFYDVLSRVYAENLRRNELALYYLRSRGLNEKTVELFRLGFASGNLPVRVAKEQGVVDKLPDLGFNFRQDPFEGRIIIPIFDDHGRVIAFAGRSLTNADKVKYLNTPETPFFRKSEILYGLNFARDAIRETEYVILTEGYFDVMLAHQAGFRNTVGVLGTNLSEDAVRKLARLTNAALLAFDSDEAGVQAALHAGEKLLLEDFDVKVVLLEDVKDVAELIARGGADALVDKSIDFVQFLLRQRLSGNKNDGYSELAQFCRALETRNLAKYRLLVDHWAAAENLSTESVEKYIKGDQRRKEQQQDFVVLAEHWYLLWLTEGRDVVKWKVELRGSAKRLAERILRGELTPSDKEFLERLRQLTADLPRPSEQHVFRLLKLKELETASKTLDVSISKAQDKNEVLELLRKKIELTKERTNLLSKIAGGVLDGEESEHYGFVDQKLRELRERELQRQCVGSEREC